MSLLQCIVTHLKLCVGRPANRKMPFKYVVLQQHTKLNGLSEAQSSLAGTRMLRLNDLKCLCHYLSAGFSLYLAHFLQHRWVRLGYRDVAQDVASFCGRTDLHNALHSGVTQVIFGTVHAG